MKTYVKYDADDGNSYSYEYDSIDCLSIPENCQQCVESENNSNVTDIEGKYNG